MDRAKTAFISGAGSGLGRELASQLADLGFHLYLTGRNPQDLEITRGMLEGLTEVKTYVADLTANEERQKLIIWLTKACPDWIINCAGLGLYGDILSFPLERQMELLEINIKALVEISIESSRELRARNKPGVIMNISSAAALFTYPSFALYAASKGFVKDFSLSFDEELRAHKIRVLTALLGRFESPFRSKAAQSYKEPSRSFDTMKLKKAARHVLRQMRKKKPYQIIDGRYRLLYGLSKLIPRRVLAYLLKKGINRSQKSP